MAYLRDGCFVGLFCLARGRRLGEPANGRVCIGIGMANLSCNGSNAEHGLLRLPSLRPGLNKQRELQNSRALGRRCFWVGAHFVPVGGVYPFFARQNTGYLAPSDGADTTINDAWPILGRRLLEFSGGLGERKAFGVH